MGLGAAALVVTLPGLLGIHSRRRGALIPVTVALVLFILTFHYTTEILANFDTTSWAWTCIALLGLLGFVLSALRSVAQGQERSLTSKFTQEVAKARASLELLPLDDKVTVESRVALTAQVMMALKDVEAANNTIKSELLKISGITKQEGA
jgi:endonuclease/exonuclease/phosphatase (EEP) superfamily protein YafD